MLKQIEISIAWFKSSFFIYIFKNPNESVFSKSGRLLFKKQYNSPLAKKQLLENFDKIR